MHVVGGLSSCRFSAACTPVPERRSTSFEKLDSIPEGVQHVYAIEPFKRFVGDRRKPGCQTTGGQFREASHQQRGMGLAGRTEIRVDAQVEPKRAAPEPQTPTPSEIRGLRFLGQAKDARIERARRRFLARGHRQLDVIEIDDFAQNAILQSVGITTSAHPRQLTGPAAAGCSALSCRGPRVETITNVIPLDMSGFYRPIRIC
jgi:hypothetical protein